jgi:hypothetical protein
MAFPDGNRIGLLATLSRDDSPSLNRLRACPFRWRCVWGWLSQVGLGPGQGLIQVGTHGLFFSLHWCRLVLASGLARLGTLAPPPPAAAAASDSCAAS